jgi:hypothetical protein
MQAAVRDARCSRGASAARDEGIGIADPSAPAMIRGRGLKSAPTEQRVPRAIGFPVGAIEDRDLGDRSSRLVAAGDDLRSRTEVRSHKGSGQAGGLWERAQLATRAPGLADPSAPTMIRGRGLKSAPTRLREMSRAALACGSGRSPRRWPEFLWERAQPTPIPSAPSDAASAGRRPRLFAHRRRHGRSETGGTSPGRNGSVPRIAPHPGRNASARDGVRPRRS